MKRSGGKVGWKLIAIPVVLAIITIVILESFISGGATMVGRGGSDVVAGSNRGLGGRLSPSVRNQINQTRDSDDAGAHQSLVGNALSATNNFALRRAAETAIEERGQRLGFVRTATQLGQWLKLVQSKDNPDGYEAILRAVNPSLSLEERFALLRQAYPAAPPTVLRLTAALAFDMEDLDGFQPILAQLVGDSLQIDDADTLSAVALLFIHEDLAVVFGDAILQNRSKMKDADLTRVLSILAEREDPNIRAVANLALERNVFPSMSTSKCLIGYVHKGFSQSFNTAFKISNAFNCLPTIIQAFYSAIM